MKDKFREILDDLPAVTPRSRLEPYRELIREMRQRNYSYREISRVLVEKCGLRVSHSTLHDFVHRYLFESPSTQERVGGPAPAGESVFPMGKRVGAGRSGLEPPRNEEIAERISAIKRRAPILHDEAAEFQFDTSEPLRLRLKPGKSQ